MYHQITVPNQEVLFITSYPPRACGIATYSKDLIDAVHRKFYPSLNIKVCALEEGNTSRSYPEAVKYTLNSLSLPAHMDLAYRINQDDAVKMVFVQHEFGLFGGEYGEYILQLLYSLTKPVSITFHTVLPDPDDKRKSVIQAIAEVCDQLVVMTKSSSDILRQAYQIPKKKISVIPHGTHIVRWRNKDHAKKVYQLDDRLILSTFGLLSSNKSIETALDALPKVVEQFPNVLYFVLGQTHPGVVQHEGEVYREFLEEKVATLGLGDNVRFVNKYLSLSELLEYLCLTDIYLFTSKDPNQAVSGTFAYAMSSACPVISTPIPHALEMLTDNAGMIIDFQEAGQLADAAIRLLSNPGLRAEMGRNAFHHTRATVWENTAVAHARLFTRCMPSPKSGPSLIFNLPEVNLEHLYHITDHSGMIQFSDICEPDIDSGYTLDDNARAMIAVAMHFELTKDAGDLALIDTYLNFIDHCRQPNGSFLNYVDKAGEFHIQNDYSNLEDSNGRAIWALGVIASYAHILPAALVKKAVRILQATKAGIFKLESPRAIAFAIKGLYAYHRTFEEEETRLVIEALAKKLLDKYNAVSDTNWKWFEEYMTYANSTLPEAMLYAYLATGEPSYKMIAHITFEFLISHLFQGEQIKVISNRGWFHKGGSPKEYGEQPIDVSYTIQALELFYRVFRDEAYYQKMFTAFSWFLGNNHLDQIIYNPLTGGCYDGLEEHSVNLNQGAESTVCYLVARLIIERNKKIAGRELPEPTTYQIPQKVTIG